MSDYSSAAKALNGSETGQVAGSPSRLSKSDFVIMCPSQDSGLKEAILSLYYLPPHFKLRILASAAVAASQTQFISDDAVKGRVSVETQSAKDKDDPFSHANAVVYSETTPVLSESATTRVIISRSADETSVKSYGKHDFAVSMNSPEALASALLSIAKAA